MGTRQLYVAHSRFFEASRTGSQRSAIKVVRLFQSDSTAVQMRTRPDLRTDKRIVIIVVWFGAA
jgi:hypothetical protein